MSGISFHGVLADGFKVTPAISAAAERTRQFARKQLQSVSPVDTGTLKKSWGVDLEGYGLRITNDAPYSPFVELGTRKMAGRHMVERSMPAIQKEFRRQLGVALGKAMAARITEGVEAPSLDYSSVAANMLKGSGGFKPGSRQRSTRYRRRK